MTTLSPSHNAVSDYQQLFDEHPLPMLIYALDTLAFLAVNDAAVAYYGYSRAEFLALSIKDIRPAEDIEKLLALVAEAKPNMENAGRWRHRKKNGTETEVEVTIKDMLFAGQKARLVIVNDVTPYLRAKQALLESEYRLASIISSAMDGIITVDASQRIVLFNAAAEKIFGYEADQVLGTSLEQLIPARFRQTHRHHVEAFGQTNTTKRSMGRLGAISGIRANGEEFPIEASISQVVSDGQKFYTVILRDITEKKRLEAQFLRAQRMESIGTLAGGIAHDLNNLLSPILMAVQMLQLRFTDEQSQKMLQLLRVNAERGAEMVKQILSFARGVEGERLALQPRHLIKEVIKILKETLPKSISIQFHIADDLWPIIGDATQLHQVLMNLCINARDAMPEGGKLNIKAENKVIDETYAQMIPEAKAGRYVLLTIGDTGIGIAPEHLTRIFDPFFTTKEKGKGTGLGLSTVQGIVRGHGGFINVYSEIGRGTEFRAHLPALEAGQVEQTQLANPELPTGHGELILIVDDELAIREVTKATLEAFNYQVLIASDGTEALATYAQRGNEIKLVLTDMMMPFLDGPATIRALQKLNPNIKIIASSGLADNGKAVEAADLGVRHFLSKPYTADRLLKLLAEIL
ncbi:MAG TPA: PAS domain S-box protein [Blastocatellia bacterium]|nr:PAS domain S-box protein [Blastocatellia bacterium]